MKLAAFDLEIAKILPPRADNLMAHAPLGVSCAAIAFSGQDNVIFWEARPKMTRDECKELVNELTMLVADGYRLVTWNGCAFDFQVLAQESGLYDEAGQLALHHTDLMLAVTFTKGYFLGLDKALQGAGVQGKVKRVVLSSGEVLTDMSGAKAPQLWADGEYDAVLSYLHGDVSQLLQLAHIVERKRAIRWTSGSGRPQNARFSRLLTVKECFGIPKPDVSWMRRPPTREQFVSWIPDWQSHVFDS